MEGDAIHLNNQFNGACEDKQYESVNTPKVTMDEKMDQDTDFNEQIIKNIAVEKELSEIASAYNLHRNENDSTVEEMDTVPAKQLLDFQSDKVVGPAQQSNETTGWDSQDLPSEMTGTNNNPNDKSIEPTIATEKSENHQNVKDKSSADTEVANQDTEKKNNPEETNTLEETSQDADSKDMEDASKDMEDASKDSQENINKDIEESSKETEASIKDVEENSKETEASNKDMEENSQETEASSKDMEENSQESKDAQENSKDNNEEILGDGEDGSQNNENSQNGDGNQVEEESEDEVPISERLQVKKEVVEEEEEEAFQEGMCGLCKEELDTNDNTLVNKHLAENHVTTNDSEFKCGECNKDYTERRGAVRHLLNYHLNFKPHKCDECPKAFARKDHLLRHKRSHDPCFLCKFCNSEFPSQAKLDKHLYKEHKEIFTSHKAIDLSDEEEVEEVSGNSDNDVNASPSQSESEEASDSDDDSSPRRFGQRKRKSPRIRQTVASKRPRRGRGRPPKKETMKTKAAPKKSAPPKKTKKELEREERERKKEAEQQRKREEERRKKEAEKKRRQKEKMREEERALERLREKERLRKEMREREEAKERAIKEEMQRRLEETLRKQKEEDEHYYDGNFIEPALHPMKEANYTLDEYSINYTNFYGGNYHEPPKKTLAQLDAEKTLMVNFEFQGHHFLSDSKASPEGKVKKAEHTEVNPNAAKGVCGLCGEEYDDSDYQALSKHIYEKHIDNSISDKKCAICGKEYSERKGLNRHMLHSHLNYKPHRCPYCPKSFSRKDHLNRHLAQHSEDKQYICEFCMKSFTRKEHLNRHLWVHKDTFPFQCSLCSRAYTEESRLSKHIKSCHFVDNNTALETLSSLNIDSNSDVTTVE